MKDQPIQSNLIGAAVTFHAPSGGRDEGIVRAVYLSSNGYPMLLVMDGNGRLVVVSHDSARVNRGS
jgi:hypothetical protein